MEELIVNLVSFMVTSWRMTTVLIASAVLAVGLAIAIPPFTGPYGIALVLLGVGVGMWWHSRAMEIRVRSA
ncbi:hypothetical protein F2P45_12510 [Massilia sp. CCM 8733]|uniref:Uncharacterized protein n=1 Tax=Massilia mucilaginosa TaxID=2609282 RepID=A0ABX0NSH5_9BURK|nr:hypothetical protein [Massilia mucilaginosa]NHZ89828.1 hypothetical protein [Massilia mucilaginosa]